MFGCFWLFKLQKKPDISATLDVRFCFLLMSGLFSSDVRFCYYSKLRGRRAQPRRPLVSSDVRFVFSNRSKRTSSVAEMEAYDILLSLSSCAE